MEFPISCLRSTLPWESNPAFTLPVLRILYFPSKLRKTQNPYYIYILADYTQYSLSGLNAEDFITKEEIPKKTLLSL